MNNKHTCFNKCVNTDYLVLFIIPVINLLFMHYYFLITIDLEIGCFRSSLIDNYLACLLDVTVILSIVWLFTLGRLRLSLLISFIVTLLWSFCNVFYARFFKQYLNWSAIGQIGNLSDASVINSMFAGFELSDLYYLFAFLLFICFYIKLQRRDITVKSLRTTLCIWILSLFLGLTIHSIYFFSEKGFIYELEKTIFTPSKIDSMWPNWTFFHKGFVRKLFIDYLIRNDEIRLTKEQELSIEKTYSDHSLRVTNKTVPENVQNIIFILVESYLSVTSDLVVDGKEITPFLNALKHDSSVYFNGHMRPNVSIGESADGQFIYMTGLLPLHSEITVSKVKKNKIIGLPEQLQKVFPDLMSTTIIPTNPSLWEQQIMSEAYGFENLFSMIDYQKDIEVIKNGYMTDGMIFRYASLKDEDNHPPFFSLILTMSMHQPYDSFTKHGFEVTDKSLPQAYRNYLNSCHYTDMQIEKYFKQLKQKGLYDNSLIIIVADHDARSRYLGMEGRISDNIPIYIINGGFNPLEAWDGECNQLDVYTTILDIMGVQGKWRGLGHTLLNRNYQNSVTEKIQEISDWIIYSDYFNKKVSE